MNVNLKLSGLYSSLFVIRFSLIFQKKFGGGGGNRKEPVCHVNFAMFLRVQLFADQTGNGPSRASHKFHTEKKYNYAKEHYSEGFIKFTVPKKPEVIHIRLKFLSLWISLIVPKILARAN